MSAANVELVRRMFRAYTEGDFDTALSCFHQDAEVDLSARGNTAVGRGPDGIRDVVASWTESWDDYGEQLDEILDLGDQIVIVSTQRGRGKGSGIEVSAQWAFVAEVRNDRIARLTAHRDRESAIEAAGTTDQI